MFYSKRLRAWRKGQGKPEYKQPDGRKASREVLVGVYGKGPIHGRCGQPWPLSFNKCPTCHPPEPEQEDV